MTTPAPSPIRTATFVKGREVYRVRYRDGQERRAFKPLFAWAFDADLSLTMADAEVLYDCVCERRDAAAIELLKDRLSVPRKPR